MQTRPRHRRRASLFALLLLVPLIHGAGAHLGDFATAVHMADDLARNVACHSRDAAAQLSAPSDHEDSHFATHAEGEFCVLCVTARSTLSRSGADVVPFPPAGHAVLRVGDDRTAQSERAHARPDAPRAPPRDLA